MVDATLTVCAELTPKKSPLVRAANPSANPFLPVGSGLLPPELEGLVLLPCLQVDVGTLPQRYDNGDNLGRSGAFDTSILSLKFDAGALSKIPSSLPVANLQINLTLGSVQLRPKYRRFAVAPSEGVVKGQSVTTVCHRRRMVRVNGEPWLGVGFYASRTLFPLNVSTPTLDVAKKTFTEMVRESLTQVMPNGMDQLHEADRASMVHFLDNDLNATRKFDMPLVADVKHLLN